MLKESIIRFQLDEARRVEADIRKEFAQSDISAFRRAERWATWEEQWQQPLLGRFLALFMVILLEFPDFVLALEGEAWQIAVYTGTFILVATVFANAANKVRKSAKVVTARN